MRKYCICKGFMTRGYVKHKRKSKCFTFAAFEDKCEKWKEKINVLCIQYHFNNDYENMKKISPIRWFDSSSFQPRINVRFGHDINLLQLRIKWKYVMSMCDRHIYLGRWWIPRNEPIRNVFVHKGGEDYIEQ